MKMVYQAAHGVDAHMVKAMLEQAGMPAQVRGEYLQGGLGELPVAGLVTVWVSETDATRAREVVLDWEQSVPEEEPDAAHDAYTTPAPHQSRRRRAAPLIAALLLVPALWWAVTRLLG